MYATNNQMAFTAQLRNELRAAIELFVDEPVKSLTNFRNTIQIQSIKEILQEYTEKSEGYGAILDGEQDTITIGGVTCIEMGNLIDLHDRFLYPIVEYFWHIQEKTLDGIRPSIHIFDEAATYFRNEIFRSNIEQFVEKRRKLNEAVIIALQTLKQAETHDHKTLSIIQENCASKIFLPNTEAVADGIYRQYEAFNLNERQISNIALMQPQREYMIIKPSGTRIFDLALDEETLAFVGANQAEFGEMERMYQQNPNQFWVNWLRAKGMDAPDINHSRAA